MPTRLSAGPCLGRGRWGGLLAALVMLVAVEAKACPICQAWLAASPGQQLSAADQVVLARQESGDSVFRVVAVVKGDGVVGAVIPEEVIGVDAPATGGGKPFVLLRVAQAPRWSSIGAIGASHAGWLRQVAATDTAAPGPSVFGRLRAAQVTAGQGERLALVLPYLEDAEPLAAEIAYSEISRAPYAAMRALRPRLDAARIARWIEDPTLAARRSGYLLLLGIAGDAADAARLEQSIEAAWRARADADLAAMLAADLELRGPSRVGWLEQAYLADRKRTVPEIRAALLALAVHGDADAAVPRARVIEAYRLFMRERKPMAGFVAVQLADWLHWDATAEYVALLESDAVKDPALRLAIVTYLNRSPREEAKVALQRDADRNR